MSESKLRRWIVMGCLILAGGAIYTLPYLRQSYQSTLLEALDIDNTELGVLNTAFGVLALVCYFPGGWLADRVSPRKLLTVSLLATGVIGFVFAALPPYPVVFVLHALWGVTTILTFWAALVKATRDWGGSDEQGRAFGILDGGRGIVEGLLGLGALAVFTAAAGGAGGLQGVLAFYSSACVLAAFLVWRFIPETEEEKAASSKPATGQLSRVLRMPVVWLHALVILCAYAAYWGTLDLAAFATDGFGQSDVFGASLSTFRIWVRPLAGISAGFLADRIGAGRAVAGSFVAIIAAYVFFVLMPTTPDALWLLWADTALAALAVFALRGVYYALLEEGGVPVALTGTAVGLVSVIGYTPDSVLPLLSGWLLDTYPGAAGHRYLYMILGVASTVGLGATLAIRVLGARARGDTRELERADGSVPASS